jgi:hypothetical protein
MAQEEQLSDFDQKKEWIKHYSEVLDRCIPIIDADIAAAEEETERRADIAKHYIDIWAQRQRKEIESISRKRRQNILSDDVDQKLPGYSQVFYKQKRTMYADAHSSTLFTHTNTLFGDMQATTHDAISSRRLQHVWFH